MFVTASPDADGADRLDATSRSRSARRRRTTTRTSPSAARPSRRARSAGTPYTAVRRRADHRAARARTDDVVPGERRRRRATSSTSTRAPSGSSPRPTSAGVAAMGQLWSTVEDLATLGDVPRPRRRRRARAADDRGDVVPAGHVLPRRLGARLGARADALQPERRRSSAATAARWRAISPASTSTARRRSARRR